LVLKTLDIYYVFFKIQNLLAAKEALTGDEKKPNLFAPQTILHKPFCTETNKPAPWR
jgi:hypothetical protein